jgi:hypothetical protein
MSNLIVCRSLRMSSLFLVALLLTLAGSRAVRADIFSTGEIHVQWPIELGDYTTATNLLENDFSLVYASRGGTLVVGDPTNFVLLFSGPETVGEYMVSNGIPGP